jgi:ATP-dependent RNA helicase RhlE
MAFKQFGLIPELLNAVEKKGYSSPTTIQEQAIPLILEGSDLLARSQTGTGKTAGFTLPLLQNLMKKGRLSRARALILTPTRELAVQVEESVIELGKFLPLKSTAIFGGVTFKSQIRALNKGIDIIVATPGRLLDLIDQKILNLSNIEILVLDEADRMLDMGFIHDIRRLLTLLPSSRQSLLFSATFSDDIKRLANGLLNSPKIIEAAGASATIDAIAQVVHPVDSKRKTELLSTIIKTNNWQQVLVFVRTKHSANKLTEKLQEEGISAVAIHGNKTQAARAKALKEFKKGAVRILVATDVAARGLDINQLPHVVNFDLPNVPEDYVHRIGRTGRAGNSGEAISLVCVDEHAYLRAIERLLKQEIPKVVIPNFQVDPSIKAQPISYGYGRQKAPRRRPRTDSQRADSNKTNFKRSTDKPRRAFKRKSFK